jgi:hypothetical protein
MTKSAEEFIDGISISWDSLDPWEATAQKGLSEYDSEGLADLCEEFEESFLESKAEVLRVIREKVARDLWKRSR